MSGCGCGPADGSGSCGCSVSPDAGEACPTCGNTGRKISAVTLRAQLKKEHLEKHQTIDPEGFNFCTNPVCDTVYYETGGDMLFGQDAVRSKVTIKNSDPETPLCYCKKLFKKDFYDMLRRGEPGIVEKIKGVIAEGKSFCEKSNPKGVCCTEDVKKFLEEHGFSWDESGQTQRTAAACC